MQLGPRNSGTGAPAGNSNYGKPAFARPAQDQDLPIQKQEDIPVIEENYTPPANEDTKPTSFDGEDEIDVKDIPF